MEQIRNKEYGGERPLFATHDLQLEDVTIHAGESALKECSNIIAINCRFEGKYPFWHTNGFIVKNCLFTEGARAALWYSQSLQMADTLVEAPKMFREMDGIKLENVQLPNALETFWYCRNIELKNVQIDKADYLFIHSENIKIQNYAQNGNYSFQYCKNVEIHNAVINSKDAFWNTENVTDDAVLDACPNVKWIGLTATGTDSLDLDACRRHKVPVSNVPGYSTHSVAQHVFSLLLSICQCPDRYYRAVKGGCWQTDIRPEYGVTPQRELFGKTLGIVGYGEIGRAVARIAQGLSLIHI